MSLSIPRTPPEIVERRLDELVEHTLYAHDLFPVRDDDMYVSGFESHTAACQKAFERSQGTGYAPLLHFLGESARRLHPYIDTPSVDARSKVSATNNVYNLRRSA